MFHSFLNKKAQSNSLKHEPSKQSNGCRLMIVNKKTKPLSSIWGIKKERFFLTVSFSNVAKIY